MFSAITRFTVLSVLIQIVRPKHLPEYFDYGITKPDNKTLETFYSYSIKHSGGSTSEQNVSVPVVDADNIELEKLIKYPSKSKQSRNNNKHLHSKYKKEDLLTLNKTHHQEADLEQEYSNMNILKLPTATANKNSGKKKNRSSKYKSKDLNSKQMNITKQYFPPILEITTPYDIITAPYADIYKDTNILDAQIQTINLLVDSALNPTEDSTLQLPNHKNKNVSEMQSPITTDQFVSETQNKVHYMHYVPLEEQTTVSSIVIQQSDTGDNTEIDVISNKTPNKDQLNLIKSIVNSIVQAAEKETSSSKNKIGSSTTEPTLIAQFSLPATLTQLPKDRYFQDVSNIFNLNSPNYPLYPPLHDGASDTIHTPITFSVANKQSLVEQLQPANNFFDQANNNYKRFNILQNKLNSEHKSYDQADAFKAVNFKQGDVSQQKPRGNFIKQFRQSFAEPPQHYSNYDEQQFGHNNGNYEDNSQVRRPNYYNYASKYNYQNQNNVPQKYTRPVSSGKPKPITKFRSKQPPRRKPVRKLQKPTQELLIIRKKPKTEIRKKVIYLKKIVKPKPIRQFRNAAPPANNNVIKFSVLNHSKREVKMSKNNNSC